MMSAATHVVSKQLMHSFGTIFYFVRVFGLAPFGVDDRGGGVKIFLSLPLVGYSALFGVTLAVLASIGVVDDLQEDEYASIRMRDCSSRIITSGDIFIVIFLVLITISTSISHRNCIYEILRCIKEVDAIVPLSNVNKLKWQCIMFMATIVILACSVLSFDLFVWNNIASRTKKSFAVANYLPFYISYIVLIIFQSEFCLAVHCIKARFEALQAALSLENVSLAIGNSFFSRRNSEISIRKQAQLDSTRNRFGTVIDKLGNSQPVQDVVFVRTADKTKKHVTPEYLSGLIFAYENLAEVVGHMNDAFGMALLIVTASVILHLIVTPYFFVLEVIGRQHKLFMVLQSIWIGVHFGRLLIIVEPCHRAQNAAEQIKPLICKLLTFDVEESIRQQLEIFNVQLIHRRVRFSICGLCEIDRSVITTIVGTITTYLVILLQFNKPN